MRNRPPIPNSVARQLRQEAGFGCANCGNPILDYHHIIEWHEKQHFDPDHMVALCPTCHRQFGKLSKKRAYHLKQNPFNIRQKRFEGYLGGNGQKKALRVGSLTVIDCKSAVSFSGNNIFSYALVDEEIQIDAFIPNAKFWPDVEIKGNNISAPISEFWDIEFKTNWVKFRKEKGEIFFSVDFRGEFVEIEARLTILGEPYVFSKNGIKSQNGCQFHNGTVSNGTIGLSIGPPGRILRPNFAMVTPRLSHFNL
ncbi:MAG: HNH endonuclease signature motif containing protein [Pseudodonghicola sp.]|nr:HNH endonuclease signature motif containing protein [Pseudodonghicola sp.]